MVVGDGPQEQTGLGRIGRDLSAILATLPELALIQVGGPAFPPWRSWEHIPMSEDDRGEDWGARYVEAVYRWRFGTQPGILFAIWDPSRLYPYLQIDLPVQRWAYTAIDGDNIRGSLGGPAAEAIRHFDRIIAYGRWASEILHTLRTPVSYLPHGLSCSTLSAPASKEESYWVVAALGPFRGQRLLIGAVAANQPRKDLGLLCHTVALLRDQGYNPHLWLHTDVMVKAWAVPQLVEDFGLQKRVTITTESFSDRQLALLYQACDVTIAPGLGEGFGYPIVESLAAGTPVVHGQFGGGQELIPRIGWRFPVRELRLDSVYGIKRPVFRAEDVYNALMNALQWREKMGSSARPYLTGSVAHLDWSVLTPRWASWVRQGLRN
jgi:glycosyltransferase involved in cell wall biosynthesis